MSSTNLYSLILFFSGIVISFIIIFLGLEKNSRSVLNIFSVLGSVSSIFGLLIAYIQIFEIKKTTEETAKAIAETKSEYLLKISHTEVTDAINVISEVEDFMKQRNYELCRKKTNVLKEKLIKICNSPSYKEFYNENDSNYLLRKTNEIQTSFVGATYGLDQMENQTTVDSLKIHKELQKISTDLSKFKNEIYYS